MIAWHVLDTASMLLVASSFYLLIWKQWVARGLSDVSYVALGLMALGSALAAFVSVYAREWWLAPVYLPTLFAAVYLISLKVWAVLVVLMHQGHHKSVMGRWR
jgi:hypothetical protein